MPRRPLALGTWGETQTYVAAVDEKGKPTRYRAAARYRDHDGRTRRVERHGKTKSDVRAGTVSITSTIIRVKGVGLLRTRTKSRAGQRVLVLPSWVVAMLTGRFTAGVQLDRPVLPDSQGGFRDPSNTSRDLRAARGTEDLSWVTSHTFRKTLATMLDDAGPSSRAVADQLGHARPSMTQDVYLSRKVLNPHAAKAVEGALDAPLNESAG